MLSVVMNGKVACLTTGLSQWVSTGQYLLVLVLSLGLSPFPIQTIQETCRASLPLTPFLLALATLKRVDYFRTDIGSGIPARCPINLALPCLKKNVSR